LQQFGKGCHRALLTSVADPNAPATIFTQSDIVRFVVRHPECIGALKGTWWTNPVSAELPNAICGENKMVSAESEKDTARSALSKLVKHNVSAIPVISSDGKLIGELSAAALRGLPPTKIPTALDIPVLDFVQQTGARPTPAFCTPNTSINQVIQEIASSQLHRVWIINTEADKKCVGVVSLTDMMRLFSKHLKQ
jgi:CBS-domain-containing membrane protein